MAWVASGKRRKGAMRGWPMPRRQRHVQGDRSGRARRRGAARRVPQESIYTFARDGAVSSRRSAFIAHTHLARLPARTGECNI